MNEFDGHFQHSPHVITRHEARALAMRILEDAELRRRDADEAEAAIYQRLMDGDDRGTAGGAIE